MTVQVVVATIIGTKEGEIGEKIVVGNLTEIAARNQIVTLITDVHTVEGGIMAIIIAGKG